MGYAQRFVPTQAQNGVPDQMQDPFEPKVKNTQYIVTTVFD